MKFDLRATGHLRYERSEKGNWSKTDGFTWCSSPYILSLGGIRSFELALHQPQVEHMQNIEIEGLGQVDFSVSKEAKQIGPAFLTKIRVAGLIVAVKIMKALEPLHPDDVTGIGAAVRSIAEEYGGVKMLSEVCEPNIQPEHDYEVCMLDDYFRKIREKAEEHNHGG